MEACFVEYVLAPLPLRFDVAVITFLFSFVLMQLTVIVVIIIMKFMAVSLCTSFNNSGLKLKEETCWLILSYFHLYEGDLRSRSHE